MKKLKAVLLSVLMLLTMTGIMNAQHPTANVDLGDGYSMTSVSSSEGEPLTLVLFPESALINEDALIEGMAMAIYKLYVPRRINNDTGFEMQFSQDTPFGAAFWFDIRREGVRVYILLLSRDDNNTIVGVAFAERTLTVD